MSMMIISKRILCSAVFACAALSPARATWNPHCANQSFLLANRVTCCEGLPAQGGAVSPSVENFCACVHQGMASGAYVQCEMPW